MTIDNAVSRVFSAIRILFCLFLFRCGMSTDDSLTLSAQDNADKMKFTFESKDEEKAGDKISEYEMKLMCLDRERLEIPETRYAAIIR